MIFILNTLIEFYIIITHYNIPSYDKNLSSYNILNRIKIKISYKSLFFATFLLFLILEWWIFVRLKKLHQIIGSLIKVIHRFFEWHYILVFDVILVYFTIYWVILWTTTWPLHRYILSYRFLLAFKQSYFFFKL